MNCRQQPATSNRRDLRSDLAEMSILTWWLDRPSPPMLSRRSCKGLASPAAEDGGADSDEGGAFLDGDLEVVAHAHGEAVEGYAAGLG